MIRYLFARLSLPFVFAPSSDRRRLYGSHLLPMPRQIPASSARSAPRVFGFFAPGVYHQEPDSTSAPSSMQLGLPDALDLMVICAEAGLSLDATLVRVSRELETTWPELAEEFGITAAELTFLPERRQAFDNLNARTNMASIRGVVNTLLQTAKFGTPLAHSLRVLAAEFRDARMITRRGKGGAAAGAADRADDPVHPADAVHRAARPGRAQHHRHLLGQGQGAAARHSRHP